MENELKVKWKKEELKKVMILSGNGTGPGHFQAHTGRPSSRAISMVLKAKRSRDWGNWAKAIVWGGELDSESDSAFGYDFESGDVVSWPKEL